LSVVKFSLGIYNTTFRVDDFGGGSYVASSVKTIQGLARASAKTVNGLAIASVKTVQGLA
jgi:hypothetical protein